MVSSKPFKSMLPPPTPDVPVRVMIAVSGTWLEASHLRTLWKEPPLGVTLTSPGTALTPDVLPSCSVPLVIAVAPAHVFAVEPVSANWPPPALVKPPVASLIAPLIVRSGSAAAVSAVVNVRVAPPRETEPLMNEPRNPPMVL